MGIKSFANKKTSSSIFIIELSKMKANKNRGSRHIFGSIRDVYGPPITQIPRYFNIGSKPYLIRYFKF